MIFFIKYIENINFSVYEFQENDNEFYLYTISTLDDPELVLQIIEFWIVNEPEKPINQYLITVNFDNVKIDKLSISPIDVSNRSFPHDSKWMDVSQNYISLIPPPKEKKKREIKPKAEKPDKQNKPKSCAVKKAFQKVDINLEGNTVDMKN